jgi:tRNA A37 methylthiotransferase MiaB
VERHKADENHLVGRSTQNKLVHFVPPSPEAAASFIGQTVKVRILKAFPTVLRGELV